jgi:hypothetical protein
MSTKYFLLLFAATALTSCTSPEQRASEQTDTNTIKYKDSTGTDTVTNVDGRSGDNSTGTDTTNTAEQKAIRESGK